MRALVFIVGTAWLAGCGTNKPELPPELKDELRDAGSGSAGYPSGPYGTEVGDVIQNLSFTGWMNPVLVDHDLDALETISLADFHDPSGSERVLLIANTAAVWCNPCRVEHSTLPQHYTQFSPRGVRLLSALFQNASGDPATLQTLQTWTQTYDSNYPMVVDPEYQLGPYASSAAPPLNLVIDTRTMTILKRSSVSDLWDYVDSELVRRGR
jgi:hypothetical protein